MDPFSVPDTTRQIGSDGLNLLSGVNFGDIDKQNVVSGVPLTVRHVNMANNAWIWTAVRYFGGCTFVGYVLLKAVTPTDEDMKEVQFCRLYT